MGFVNSRKYFFYGGDLDNNVMSEVEYLSITTTCQHDVHTPAQKIASKSPCPEVAHCVKSAFFRGLTQIDNLDLGLLEA
jgi:hypothetical protein